MALRALANQDRWVSVIIYAFGEIGGGGLISRKTVSFPLSCTVKLKLQLAKNSAAAIFEILRNRCTR